MKANEKAKELIEKFSSINMLGLDTSKKYALIAVDELIKESKSDCVTIGRNQLTDFEYWLEVKTELEKL